MRGLEEPIFWEVFHRHEALRGDLARLFQISPPTVSRAVDALCQGRFIVETIAMISSRGRRPGVLQINPELAWLLGLEIDRDHITAAVTDMAGSLRGRGSARCSVRDSYADALALCRQLVHDALHDAGLKLNRMSALGVGHTGSLDHDGGVCVSWAGAPSWRNVRLRGQLADLFRLEVVLDDRARAIALAERRLSAADARHSDAIYIHIGTGVGCGIFLNNRLIRGASLAGGEIGHMVIDRAGPLCACGNRGCLEAMASSGAVVDRVMEAMRQGRASTLASAPPARPEIVDVAAAASAGDEVACEAICFAGQALGLGVANAVQLLNPSLVVLCGRLAWLARERMLDAVSKVIREQCFETITRHLEVRLAPFRKDVAAVGCALLAAEAVARERLLPFLAHRKPHGVEQ